MIPLILSVCAIAVILILYFHSKAYHELKDRYISLLSDHIHLRSDAKADDDSCIMIKDNHTNYVLYRIGKSGNHIEILSIPYNEIDRDYKFLCAQERAELLNEKL